MDAQIYTDQELIELLRDHDIHPTSQRVDIARVLFAHGRHVSAEDVFEMVNTDFPDRNRDAQRASKATVYNTLGLFASKGLIRQVIADPSRVFYDPNTTPHYHFYHVDTGTLSDIDDANVMLTELPSLPVGSRLEGVDVIVRINRK